ncbi:MAG: CBS domain-containing protein [Polyangiales bacterium]
MATTVEQLLNHKGRQIHAVEPSTPIGRAVALFGERQIGAVLVCDSRNVVGVLSERDLLRGVLWKNQCTTESPVRDVMRIDFPTVESTDSIQHCMSLMNDRRTRHLPVIDQGTLVGIISIGDVINGLLREQQHLIESLEVYISGSPSIRPAH